MLGILDSVIIVISLALVVSAVLRAAGKKQTDAEYFLAGRDLRWPFIGMSLLASAAGLSANCVRHGHRTSRARLPGCDTIAGCHHRAPIGPTASSQYLALA